MARIAGVTIPSNKRSVIALTYIYGIGKTRAHHLCQATGVNESTRVKDLTEEELTRIRDMIDKNYRVEGELRHDRSADVKRLKDIGSYRGERHKRHLPVRGQRTKTNSRTVRGNVRRTTTSGRRILTKT
jgi:small subunit ribosomal protein S13